MSEELEPRVERREQVEVSASPEKDRSKPDTVHEKTPEKDTQEIESLSKKAHAEAKSGREVKVDKSSPNRSSHHLATKEIRTETLKRSLGRARKHLSAPDKALSKLIHQPVVDGLSKVGEKTIARPKGILSGAIVALAGSSYLLYSAKHYGFKYNYLIVIILFAGGYVIGLLIELLSLAFRRSNK